MVLKVQAFCYSCSSHKGALLRNDWGLQFGTDSVCQTVDPQVFIQPERPPFCNLHSIVTAVETAQAGIWRAAAARDSAGLHS